MFQHKEIEEIKKVLNNDFKNISYSLLLNMQPAVSWNW